MTWVPVVLPPDDTLPLLRARVGDVAPAALVMGDPARVERAAELLTDAEELGRNREYLTVVGTWAGERVTLASHGVGSAGAAVCVEELMRAGVRRVIRCGTAGGLRSDVVDADLVVATGAIRDEGTTHRLVADTVPAVAEPALVSALVHAGRRLGAGTVHAGVVLTSDTFYPGPASTPLETWVAAGAIAVEMELSVVLVVAALHGAEGGGILAVDGSPLAGGDDSMSGYDPHRDHITAAADAAVRAGLDALVASPLRP